jgi:3',5'-nucleoside bisphosphate phosphatase
VIDLHLHTTASDGCCTAEELIARASAAGVHTLAVTDHDTMAAVPEAAQHASARGMTFVPGIEITAVAQGRDVHVLGYFLRPDSPELTVLIGMQRQERFDRAREIVDCLANAGAPIDDELLFAAFTNRTGPTIARPQIAQALIRAGHASSVSDAFQRFLSEGGPAYVPHKGPHPQHVVEVITRAGGIASLAHPGPLRRDDLIPALVDSGLAAIEAYHSDHDGGTQQRYLELARNLNLAVTGGSDYHGNGRPRDSFFGVVSLPPEEFNRLTERVNHATA